MVNKEYLQEPEHDQWEQKMQSIISPVKTGIDPRGLDILGDG